MRFGDILPPTSGASHVGVNGNGVGGFDITSMAPFGHIICLSGVYLDPKTGQSGVLRFSQADDAIQFSTDGGLTFDDIGAGSSLPNTCFSAAFSSMVGATFTHNLNVTDVIVQTRDSAGNILTPEEITVVDANNVFVAFASAQTGRITIVACGGDNGLKDVYYRGGNTVLIDTSTVVTGDSDIMLITGNRKFILGTQGSRFPLSLSGVYAFLDSGRQLGDIAVFGHSVINPGFSTPPTSQAQASAQALGPGTMVLNTGSGQINLMTGSGIGFFMAVNDLLLAPDVDNWVRVPIHEGSIISDASFSVDGLYSGVRFFAPGIYKVDYAVLFEKVLGNVAKPCAVRAVLTNPGNEGQYPAPSQPHIAVSGSIGFALVANTTNQSHNSTAKTFLVNIDPGQFLAIEAAVERQTGVGQDISIIGSGTTMMVQYIGPRRSAF